MNFDKNYFESHPVIIVEKKSGSLGEDKSVYDSKLLIPTLVDIFHAHPLLNPEVFSGDAAFDTTELYKSRLTSDTSG